MSLSLEELFLTGFFTSPEFEFFGVLDGTMVSLLFLSLGLVERGFVLSLGVAPGLAISELEFLGVDLGPVSSFTVPFGVFERGLAISEFPLVILLLSFLLIFGFP